MFTHSSRGLSILSRHHFLNSKSHIQHYCSRIIMFWLTLLINRNRKALLVHANKLLNAVPNRTNRSIRCANWPRCHHATLSDENEINTTRNRKCSWPLTCFGLSSWLRADCDMVSRLVSAISLFKSSLTSCFRTSLFALLYLWTNNLKLLLFSTNWVESKPFSIIVYCQCSCRSWWWSVWLEMLIKHNTMA